MPQLQTRPSSQTEAVPTPLQTLRPICFGCIYLPGHRPLLPSFHRIPVVIPCQIDVPPIGQLSICGGRPAHTSVRLQLLVLKLPFFAWPSVPRTNQTKRKTIVSCVVQPCLDVITSGKCRGGSWSYCVQKKKMGHFMNVIMTDKCAPVRHLCPCSLPYVGTQKLGSCYYSWRMNFLFREFVSIGLSCIYNTPFLVLGYR